MSVSVYARVAAAEWADRPKKLMETPARGSVSINQHKN